MKGYIYKIISIDTENKHIYIGSTNESLKKRLEEHKVKAVKWPDRKVYKYISENGGWDQFEIKIVEKIEYENDTELKIKEEEYRAAQEQSLLLNTYKSYISLEDREEYFKQYRKDYKEKNRERIKEKNMEYRKDNKENIIEYREKNKERIKEQRKEYYKNNKEELLKKNKEYQQNNNKQIKEQRKEYYKNNKEIILQKDKAYYKKNKEKCMKTHKEYYENNKEQLIKYAKNYRQNNKEKLKKRLNHIECNICGMNTSKTHFARHQKSKQCQEAKKIYDFIYS